MSFTRQSNHQQSKRRDSAERPLVGKHKHKLAMPRVREFYKLKNRTTLKQHKTANMLIQVLWLALESEDKERALDPGIQKNQPGSPRMEEEPGFPSRDRHYVHIREHVNFTCAFQKIKAIVFLHTNRKTSGGRTTGNLASLHHAIVFGILTSCPTNHPCEKCRFRGRTPPGGSGSNHDKVQCKSEKS